MTPHCASSLERMPCRMHLEDADEGLGLRFRDWGSNLKSIIRLRLSGIGLPKRPDAYEVFPQPARFQYLELRV